MIVEPDGRLQQKWKEMYQLYLRNIFGGNNENYDFYIAVTRKGYYFSKIQNVICFDNMSVLRDRDILKSYDFTKFKGKKVLLFDDTANTGETLSLMKERLEKQTDNNITVDVAAFAVNPFVLKQKVEKKLFRDRKLYYYCMMDEEQMANFSLGELHEIHDKMIPYVIDLPVFVEKKLTKEQFDKLIRKNKENWNFYDYSFVLLNKEYENGFFQYENIWLKQIFGDALLVNIIKCRYQRITENGVEMVKVRFTPFTMMKSVIYQEMANCLIKLYKDTPYEQYLKESGYSTENDYIAVYRDVVYNLSFFVGFMFQRYCLEEYNIVLDLDYNLNKSSQNEDMKKSIKQTFRAFSFEKYINNLHGCTFTYWKKAKITISETEYADFQKVKGYILGRLSIWKLESLDKRENGTYTRGNTVLFEEIEEMMGGKFKFRSENEFYLYFVKIILLALDCSFMSNDLIYNDGEIKRVFRFGECSELYFGYDIRLFYLAIYAYLNSLGASVTLYAKHYKAFIKSLNDYLHNNNYFKYNYISEEGFYYFAAYFNLQGKVLLREIKNKRFILKDKFANNPYCKAVILYVSNLHFD